MTPSFTRTRIVATVGPACSSKEKLLELIVAGVDVFRLNFSHGSHEEHLEVINNIKDLRQKFGFNVSILQDLQGPKIRCGQIENGGVEITEGQQLIITTVECLGNQEKVSCSYQSLAKDIKSGDSILIDDGKIELKVFKVEGNEVFTKVVFGGILKSKKGINLPDTDISEPSLTRKDKEDLAFGIKQDVDWIAISFVRSPGDVLDLKNIIHENGKNIGVVSKIERPEAIKKIDRIIEASDALMVARGDLGVEVQMERVPLLQKEIVKKCNAAAKPVIIATQMMESMITNPRPTRAEANDVANAVMDGADAVMLSGETAVGKFPLQVIQSMTNIIKEVEVRPDIYHKTYAPDPTDPNFGSNRIVDSACDIAKVMNAKAIIAMTMSGFTAYRVSRHRPFANIFCFTANRELLTRMSLVWGVRAYYYNRYESNDSTFKDLEEMLVKEGFLTKGDVFINTASMPMQERLRTNMLKISRVEG